MPAMEFTGYLHFIYTNLPRERVIALTQALFQQRYGFRWESNDWQGEDWLLFHRDQAMMDHHLDHGYNEDLDGQGCVGFEGQTADWLGLAHAMEVNGIKADPDDIDLVAHMCLKGIYHITLVLPGDVDDSAFSRDVLAQLKATLASAAAT